MSKDIEVVARTESLLSEKLTNAQAAFDGSLILAIINAIISVFKNCKQNSAVIAASLQAPTVLTRLIVRNQVAKVLREQYGLGAWFRHDGAKVEKAVLAAGSEATSEDVQALMDVDLIDIEE